MNECHICTDIHMYITYFLYQQYSEQVQYTSLSATKMANMQINVTSTIKKGLSWNFPTIRYYRKGDDITYV